MFLQTILGFQHHTSQAISSLDTMPTGSSNINEQKVLDYDWLEAKTLPDNTTCDIENCRTPKATLTPETAWSAIVRDDEASGVTAYAGTNCIEKAILTQSTATPDPDAPVTVASMGRTIRGLDLAWRFRMRGAGSAGAPTRATSGSIPEQDSKDHPSKD